MNLINILKFLADDANNYFWWAIPITATILCLPWIALFIYLVIKKYRVRFFDSMGLIKTVMLKAGEDIPFPEMKKEGYEFVGWYLDPEFEKVFPYSKMPKQFLKAYAKWRRENDEL